MDERALVLLDAMSLIMGDRDATHGDYKEQSARIGMAWAAILGLPEPVPPVTVAVMMAALKGIRATGSGMANRDDYVDMAGYVALAAWVDGRL